MIWIDSTVLLLLLGGLILGVAGGFMLIALELAQRWGFLD